MVHTAKFFLVLSRRDIEEIVERHKESITLVAEIIDSKFEWASTGIYFDYRKEGYKRNCWILDLKVDFIEMLGKSEIDELDYIEVEKEIDKYLLEIFGHIRYKLTLIRLDYRVDIKLDKLDREILLKLYKKSYQKHGFKRVKKINNIIGAKELEKLKKSKRIEDIDTSIYFQSKSIGILIYDKESERRDKNMEINEYEKNILRMEIAIYNRHLNYKKNKYYTPKELKTYFKKGFYKRYIKDNLETFINKGDYYKLYISEKIINDSKLKEKEKIFLREFLVDVSKSNLTNIMNLIDEKGKNKYDYYKRKKALKMLEELNINPVSIPRNWKCKNCIENPLKFINYM